MLKTRWRRRLIVTRHQSEHCPKRLAGIAEVILVVSEFSSAVFASNFCEAPPSVERETHREACGEAYRALEHTMEGIGQIHMRGDTSFWSVVGRKRRTAGTPGITFACRSISEGCRAIQNRRATTLPNKLTCCLRSTSGCIQARPCGEKNVLRTDFRPHNTRDPNRLHSAIHSRSAPNHCWQTAWPDHVLSRFDRAQRTGVVRPHESTIRCRAFRHPSIRIPRKPFDRRPTIADAQPSFCQRNSSILPWLHRHTICQQPLWPSWGLVTCDVCDSFPLLSAQVLAPALQRRCVR